MTTTHILPKMDADQRKAHNFKGLHKLARIAGSKAHLARMMGVRYSTMFAWFRNREIAKKYVARILKHPSFSEMTLHELRIDVYNLEQGEN